VDIITHFMVLAEGRINRNMWVSGLYNGGFTFWRGTGRHFAVNFVWPFNSFICSVQFAVSSRHCIRRCQTVSASSYIFNIHRFVQRNIFL